MWSRSCTILISFLSASLVRAMPFSLGKNGALSYIMIIISYTVKKGVFHMPCYHGARAIVTVQPYQKTTTLFRRLYGHVSKYFNGTTDTTCVGNIIDLVAITAGRVRGIANSLQSNFPNLRLSLTLPDHLRHFVWESCPEFWDCFCY